MTMQLQEHHHIKIDNQYPEGQVLIRCPFERCQARIIPLDTVRNAEVSIENSPEMLEIHDSSAIPTPASNEKKAFFKVDDVWDFDNIGVSKPAHDLKQPIIRDHHQATPLEFKIERLLVCSECDKGPLGFAGFQNKDTDVKSLKYFLGCKSVLYEDKS